MNGFHHGMTITIYGADWCGDCRRAKTWLDDQDIPYSYVDLSDDPEQTEQVLERTNGVKKIPVIVFPDDSHLVEPSTVDLAAHVAELEANGIDLRSPSAGPGASAEAPAVVENSHLGRFELLRNGSVVSFASYRSRDDGAVVVPHVETDPAHRGNGYAAELMEGMLAILRADGRSIVPLCPFAAQHIRDNPAHHDLVAAR